MKVNGSTLQNFVDEGYTCRETTEVKMRPWFEKQFLQLRPNEKYPSERYPLSCKNIYDAYQIGDRIMLCTSPPWPLASREFFALVRDGIIVETCMWRIS